MKDEELATILEAMRAAQAELVGILERREVVRAARQLRPPRRLTAVSELAEAS